MTEKQAGTVAVANLYHLPQKQIPVDPTFVYIGRAGAGRPGPLGNPIKVGGGVSREEAVDRYREWLKSIWAQRDHPVRRQIEDMARQVANGDNLTLVCFCKPARCHGDVMKETVERVATMMREHDNTTKRRPMAAK